MNGKAFFDKSVDGNEKQCLMGQKILKNPGQKNSSNQINQFHELFFFTKFQFLQFQKWPKLNF